MRIACSKYSDLDDKVIKKATSVGLPLTGGTALEIWADYYNKSGVRKRSDNDIDFTSNDDGLILYFTDWVQQNIDPTKVDVDIMKVKSHDLKPYMRTVNGVLLMSLPYILWSKLIRGKDTDMQDIKWILSIPQVTDEELQTALESLGVTDLEIQRLNEALS